ncbi:putative acetyltransferase [Acetoanaerobium pronyense]|uniref:Acetyltransferase n=1 Tax=Acetoanaerobium pronyense TaxID=1482736 RepID=A0ABS4KEW6_9FIRM|nr:GNAT family N-acetyltransferase [Acetoanaerobium pronyense]MBP2026306.1 putative acetyltransferase [Acetoanaerobium pronyense]
MGFRYAEEKDIQIIRELWMYSFNEDASSTDYYFENRYSKDYNALWDEEEIKASLQLNPYTLSIKGKKEKTSYVVGISVYPEHRGKKLTTKLLKASLLDLIERGGAISLLMPIDTDIYRRYGYENCFDMEVYNLSIRDIKIRKDRAEKTKRVREITKQDIKDIQNIYSSASKNWDNYIERDEDYFKELFKEVKSEAGEIFISYDKDEGATGYMIFYPKFEGGSKGFVREMFYKNSSSLNTFLSIIKSHRTQFKDVEICQEKDSYLKDFWGYDNKIKVNIKPFMMARIINPALFLNNMGIKNKIPLKMKIIDSFLDINNKAFIISENDVIESNDENNIDFIIDIGSLTQIALGYIGIENAVFTEKIVFLEPEKKENIVSALKEIFPNTKSFINDYI